MLSGRDDKVRDLAVTCLLPPPQLYSPPAPLSSVSAVLKRSLLAKVITTIIPPTQAVALCFSLK
jgi:hypothetical protein